MAEALRCSRCRSRRLTLIERQIEFHVFDEGLILVDGVIRPDGDGYSQPGEVLVEKTRIVCQECGHNWHPRRRFDPVCWHAEHPAAAGSATRTTHTEGEAT